MADLTALEAAASGGEGDVRALAAAALRDLLTEFDGIANNQDAVNRVLGEIGFVADALDGGVRHELMDEAAATEAEVVASEEAALAAEAPAEVVGNVDAPPAEEPSTEAAPA